MSKAKKYLSKAKKVDEYKRKRLKATLKKPSRKLYTEEESKRRRSLLAKKRNLEKKRDAVSATNYVVTNKQTMKDIRKAVGQGVKDDAWDDELDYELNKRGYFQEPDYSSRDFREWMMSNGDDELLAWVLDTVKLTKQIDDEPIYELDPNSLGTREISKYNAQLSDIEAELSKINVRAQARKDRAMLRYLNQKYAAKNGSGLLEALARGEVIYDELSNPEKAAIDYMKTTIANTIIKGLNLDSMDPDKARTIKNAIYTGIMTNPAQGIKAALRGQMVLNVTKKYGNEEGELAGGMMDFMTSVIGGRPNVKGLAGTLLSYTINNSGLNRTLMEEASEELVNAGESTSTEENKKMLSRDVMLDIAKDVILSGGNLVSALPKVIKDIIVDSAQYKLREPKAKKNDEANEKLKQKIEKGQKKAEEAQKKAQEKTGGKNIGELTEEEQNEILEKFLS